MSTNQTTNYELNQWLSADQVLRTDFNADNAKLDAALADLEADVSEKASQTALDALSSTVAGHTAAIAALGNCQIVFGTYTGTGTAGSAAPNTLTFSHKPVLVTLRQRYYDNGDSTCPLLVRDSNYFYGYESVANSRNEVTWGATSVSWYSPGERANYQYNTQDVQYVYVVLLQCSE